MSENVTEEPQPSPEAETPAQVIQRFAPVTHYVEQAPPKKNLTTSAAQTRAIKIGQIVRFIKDGMRPESACWAAEIDPEELAELMQADFSIKKQINKALALAERELVLAVKKGGKGTDPARAALFILRGTYSHWNRRSNVNLAAQLDDALRDMRKRLVGPMTGEQAMKIVLDTLSRA